MLEVKNLSFAYLGCEPLFKNLMFHVKHSERLAIQAPSGYGKSTLCRLLAAYEQADSGSILVNGQLLARRGACPVQLIGQHPELFLNPYMRMGKSLAEAGSISWDILNTLGIKQEWFDRFPHELSGGELQRFCIARAFAAHPKFLIADEISTMLDALTQSQIWHFILNECKYREIGLVFVSHSPALTARLASRVLDLTEVCSEQTERPLA